jgi:UPF0716 family protein affecting phage T7 exclusion
MAMYTMLLWGTSLWSYVVVPGRRFLVIIGFLMAIAEVVLTLTAVRFVGWSFVLSASAISCLIAGVVGLVVLWHCAPAIVNWLNAEEPEGEALIGGVVLAVAWTLLIIPGLITSGAALMLLFPAAWGVAASLRSGKSHETADQTATPTDATPRKLKIK